VSNRTKIVATLGPASCSAEMLHRLYAAGMRIVRLNGSHGDMDWHAQAIALVHKELPHVPILFDVPGRKIRTTLLAHERTFKEGDVIVLTNDLTHDGHVKVPISYGRLHEDVAVGDVIFADDGTLRFSVVAIEGGDIHCRAEAEGILKSRKGINVPNVSLKNDTISDRDRTLFEFVKKHEVDLVGISFVESKAHVEAVRELIGGASPRVLAKVENAAALRNLDEIIEAADAVMIDRGDLAVETSIEDLALSQKRILKVAQRYAKPVIVATEMLHTMITSPLPTKAEVADITNAILDGAAATMLSGETAVGRFPVQAVELVARVTRAVEKFSDAQDAATNMARDDVSIPRAIGEVIGSLARILPITKIVAITATGYAARAVSAQRPPQPIIAVTNDALTARSLNLLSGVQGYHAGVSFSRRSNHIVECLKVLWEKGMIGDDDMILVTAVSYPNSGNRMNLLQTHIVRDLAENQGWKKA
jgi:pyruvate kinase